MAANQRSHQSHHQSLRFPATFDGDQRAEQTAVKYVLADPSDTTLFTLHSERLTMSAGSQFKFHGRLPLSHFPNLPPSHAGFPRRFGQHLYGQDICEHGMVVGIYQEVIDGMA